MAEALEDGLVSDPQSVRRYHETISMETERLAHLVDELFELSVIQAGALRLELERVSLGDLVSDAMSGTLPAAGARRVRVAGRLTDDAPLELWLDPREISRVLRNLLENAIRHTPNDGAVSIEAGVEGDHAYLAVQDECGGIPETEIGRVFEPSFRGGAARTPNGNGDGAGAGLGLAIARGIIEAHHGRITVRNRTPGCRFEVRLPALVRP
jgi:signal transduction histidine kinase